MKDKIKKYRNEIIIGIFIIIVSLALIVISDSFLLAPDEYNYSHITWSGIKIDSFSKIFQSQALLYEAWTGRIPVHFIIQFLLWKGIWIYKILNFIIFGLLVVLINHVTNKKLKVFNVFFTIFCLIFLIEDFADKFLWLSGSINYLWTTTLMLVLIKFYYDIIIDKKELTLIKGILFCVVSFFAGWSQENVAFFIGSFIIVLGIYKFKEFLKYDKKSKILIILNILFFGIGVILLLFSPGNFARMDSAVSSSIISKAKNIYYNLLNIKYLILIYFISAGIIIFSKNILKGSKNEKINFLKNEIILFFIPLAVSMIPMLFISEFPPRAMLPYETMLLVAIIYNFDLITNNLCYKKVWNTISILLFILIVVRLGKEIYISRTILSLYKIKVLEQIEIADKENFNDVIVDRLDDSDINDDTDFILNYSPLSTRDGLVNTYMSIYYGFNSIIGVKDNEYLVSIKLTEPVKGIKNYSIIDEKTNETISEYIDEDSIQDVIDIVIPKDELGSYKIYFKNNIKDKIQSIKLYSNINIENRIMETKDISYDDIIGEK